MLASSLKSAELKQKASKVHGVGKYDTLMLDELSVQDDLVLDRSTNQLVGILNLREEQTNCFGRRPPVSLLFIFSYLWFVA